MKSINRKSLINFNKIEDQDICNLTLYKYLKVDNFIKMLKTKKLYFRKPHTWDDPFENLFLNSEINSDIDMNGLKEHIFAQCWTLKEESDLMWNSYISDQNGIKLEVKFEELYHALTNNTIKSLFFGIVRYLTEKEILSLFDKPFIVGEEDFGYPILHSLLIKRQEFSEECELRIILQDLLKKSANPNIDILNNNMDEFKDDYRLVDIDINVFEKVVFHPKMDDSLISCYKQIFEKNGFNGSAEKSTLYNAPKIKIVLRTR